MHALEEELDALEKNRLSMRVSRDRSGLPKIAIVGYTNAGKSTLLNTLTGAGILAEDKLFATLDPTTRKFTLPGGEQEKEKLPMLHYVLILMLMLTLIII